MISIAGNVLTYVGIVIVGFLVWAALSPFEVMGWWAGWFGDTLYREDIPSEDGLVRAVRPQTDSYVVFMSGIGRVSSETLSYRERDFLRRLALAMPRTVIIDDVFPYSVNGVPLTGQPFFARLWRMALRSKLHGPKLVGYLINIRNLWQVMISADKRYGPMFNQAAAEVILDGLMRYDYDPEGNAPIYLVGSSGAMQIAAGAAGYLAESIAGPIVLISLGGIFSSDPSLLAVQHIYHLQGSRDGAQKLNYLAPGKWSIFASSEWNRMRRQGRVTAINMGPMSHLGRGSYLDATSELPDGTPYVERTVDVIQDIVQRSMYGATAEPTRSEQAEIVPSHT
ncbi:MAG: hypothetical protein ACK2UO_12890 [Caldilineaceae bacterium]